MPKWKIAGCVLLPLAVGVATYFWSSYQVKRLHLDHDEAVRRVLITL